MPDHLNATSSKQSGNALWFILIGVALLAALTAAVSRNSTTVTQTGSVEQNRITASGLLRYGQSLNNAIQTMTLNGVSESDLDFSDFDAIPENPNCDRESCDVFHVNGGAVTKRDPIALLGRIAEPLSWTINAQNRVNNIGCSDNNDACRDLLLILENVPQAICAQVNTLQRVRTETGEIPALFNMETSTPFNGDYTDGLMNSYLIGGETASTDAPALDGKIAGCVYEYGTSQNMYTFYYVLLAR